MMYNIRGMSVYNNTKRDIILRVYQEDNRNEISIKIYQGLYSEGINLKSHGFIQNKQLNFEVQDNNIESFEVIQQVKYAYTEQGEAYILEISEINSVYVMTTLHQACNYVQIVNQSDAVPYYEGYKVGNYANVSNPALFDNPFYVSTRVNKNRFAEVDLTKVGLEDITLVTFKAINTDYVPSEAGRETGEVVGSLVGAVAGVVLTVEGGEVIGAIKMGADKLGIDINDLLGKAVGKIGGLIGGWIDDITRDPYANQVMANIPVLYTNRGNSVCRYTQTGNAQESKLTLDKDNHKNY